MGFQPAMGLVSGRIYTRVVTRAQLFSAISLQKSSHVQVRGGHLRRYELVMKVDLHAAIDGSSKLRVIDITSEKRHSLEHLKLVLVLGLVQLTRGACQRYGVRVSVSLCQAANRLLPG